MKEGSEQPTGPAVSFFEIRLIEIADHDSGAAAGVGKLLVAKINPHVVDCVPVSTAEKDQVTGLGKPKRDCTAFSAQFPGGAGESCSVELLEYDKHQTRTIHPFGGSTTTAVRNTQVLIYNLAKTTA